MSINYEKYLFYTLVTSLYIQFWFDVSGITVRLEDLISGILVSLFSLRVINGYKLKKFRTIDWVILWFAIVIAIAIMNSIMSNYPLETKKDALINGIRMLLCILSFFVAYDLIKRSIVSLNDLLKLFISISFLTTTVSVLQILHWDGILPFQLPSFLTTLKEGANVEQGREIFGLYVGDTGSHKWSAMLSTQIILVFFYCLVSKKKINKFLCGIYLIVMFYVLLRISVRNSILGVILSVVAVLFLNNLPHKKLNFRDLTKAFGVLIISIATLFTIVSLLPDDNYYTQRFLSAIPKLGSDGLVIDRASNIVGRIYYWYFAWTIFLTNPVFGTGLFSYEYLSLTASAMPAVHAHNSYFNYLAETGLIGFLSLFVMLWYIFKKIWSLRKVPFRNISFLTFKNFLLTSFIFICFTSFFGNTMYQTPELMIRFLFLGSVLSFINHQKVYFEKKL